MKGIASRLMLLGSTAISALGVPDGARAQQAAQAEVASPSDPYAADIVVTAQKRSESIQRVPIAVSAFTEDALAARRIDGGTELLQSVPNINYSRATFRDTFNFSIRGIGSKVTAQTSDTGVSIHENYSPVAGGNLADTEFFDVERVEVLRGPQGTLYGRNATGGVVNVITNKAVLGQFAGSFTGEYGSFNDTRGKGFINVPLGSIAAVRIAAFGMNRDGYGKNSFTGDRVDGRRLYSTRTSIRLELRSDLRFDFMWEHFHENDDRSRSTKMLCAKDDGPTTVGGVAILNSVGGPAISSLNAPGSRGNLAQGFLSQGCANLSLQDPRSLGTPNSRATIFNLVGVGRGLFAGDVFQGVSQRAGLHDIASPTAPRFQVNSNLYQLNAEWEFARGFRLISTTAYSKSSNFSAIDAYRAIPSVKFNNLTPIGAVTVPGASGNTFVDPQIGAANALVALDDGAQKSRTWSEEVRVQSDLGGFFDFNAGYIHYDFRAAPIDTWFISNVLTIAANIANLSNPSGPQIPIDMAARPGHSGHNYNDNYIPKYHLKSDAYFGEIYIRPRDGMKITAGLRYNDDSKYVENTVPQLLVPIPPGPQDQGPSIPESSKFRELTGRIGIDVQVRSNSLAYLFFSRGYKPGGFNPLSAVSSGLTPLTYGAERVDAFEVGSKNTFANGRATVNFSAFHYRYGDYQVSKVVLRQSVTENINAKIWGAEIESTWQPTDRLRFNFSGGYLNARISGGQSVDVLDRTQGDSAYTFIKGSGAAGCIAPTSAVSALINLINTNPAVAPTALLGFCPTAAQPHGAYFGPGNPLAALGIAADEAALPGAGDGVPVNLKNKLLPNAPHWTLSIGAQYRLDLGGDWTLTPRADLYWQASSFSRVYNNAHDKLSAYSNTNITVALANIRQGFQATFFVKNLFNKRVIQDAYVQDDAVGLYSNIFASDPRIMGMTLTKSF